MTTNQKPTVSVQYGDHRQWSVAVLGYNHPGDHAAVVVGWFSTKAAATKHAKNLRAVLREGWR